MFAKTSLVTAILAAFSSTASSAQMDSSITQDMTLTEHTDLSISGSSPIIAGTDSNPVSIDLNGYDLTLSKTTTTSDNKGIFYNTVFSGKGNEHLTVNAQLIGGGIGMAYPQLMEWLANREPAVVLMEACKGSMVHARNIADLGHDAHSGVQD